METFYISLDFFSEKGQKGNMTRYYFKGFNNGKVSFGQRAFAKKYVSRTNANKVLEKLTQIYPDARVEIQVM